MDERRRLVLASTSAYRRALLERLSRPFECAAPEVDESPQPGESPAQTAQRLACAKAAAVAPRFADALIIGSDQVASLGALRLEKPGTHANAMRQLQALSGRTAQFDTAVCLLDSARAAQWVRVVPCQVTFRRLEARTIETYLRREQPYDCAGSAKSEGLGIALIERIDTQDPTALIGLPLIALTELLAAAGQPVIS
jgi:7-methyl-GTP pyrophosphatase